MPSRLVTLTLNPALDIACTAASVVHTHKIRTWDDHLDPGGGGINVARVLHELGGDVLAVMMGGGVTGALIEEMLDAGGVPHRNIPIRGRTRICFNVFEESSGLEYRFVQEGPDVTDADWHRMLEVLPTIPADWLIASGSLEHGMPEDIYARIARAAHRRGQHFVLDTSGRPLRAALGSGVTLVKPSLGELESVVGRPLPDRAAQETAAFALVQSGAAELIAVTLGADGVLLASRDGVLRQAALPCDVRSAVGAGDSFTAAMTLALARGDALAEALRWGVAAGTAAVACAGTARLRRADVEQQYRRLLDMVPERRGDQPESASPLRHPDRLATQ
jgi:6-phosphofructokinase 2